MHVYPRVYLPTIGVSIFKILVYTKIAVYSKLPTHLTYFTSRCVLRKCSNFESYNPILLRIYFILFVSLTTNSKMSRRNGWYTYTLSSSSNFGIRHQHLLVFHPTFRVSHVCNFQLPLLSHMNFIIQLVTNKVRLRHFKLNWKNHKKKIKSSHVYLRVKA